MEIILSKYCKRLTGTLSRSHGYAIRSCKGRDGKEHFYSYRCASSFRHPEGHLAFIECCVGLTHSWLADDILITAEELCEALLAAGKSCAELEKKSPHTVLNAQEVQHFLNRAITEP